MTEAVEASKAGWRASDETRASMNAQVLDARQSAKLVRKIDLHLIPFLFFLYLVQYLDKNSLNFASVFGLQKSLGLSSSEYSWLSSIFYFGYLVFQYPGNYLMQRYPTAKVLSITTLLWGVCLLSTPGCKNFAGIAVNRFFLGIFEAPVNPGFVLMMSMWYTTREQPWRLVMYYSTNGLATMFGGLLGYAIGHINGALPQWAYIFLIFGAISFLLGIATYIWMPDAPSTAWFLTPEERIAAAERLVQYNQAGVKNSHFKRSQLMQAIFDPKSWILFVMAIAAQIPNSALTSFGSLIIKQLGYDTLQTQYLQIPGGFIQFAALLLGGFVCSRVPNLRCATMVVANSICILGAALLVALPQRMQWARLVAYWLCYCQGLGFSISLTMISSNVNGYTKKQVTAALLFVGYCIGNIASPQFFTPSDEYHSAYVAMLTGYTIKLVMVFILYAYMRIENKRRDRAAAAAAATEGVHEKRPSTTSSVETDDDMTEVDNKAFRYTL